MFSRHYQVWLPVIILIALLIFVFEIWMIIDVAINNKKISDKAKAWWIVSMLVLHPFVAIVYFFTARRKR